MIRSNPKRSADLSAVGQIIHRQAAVQLQAQPEVAQAARQVALHQDVGALEVTVDNGHLQVTTAQLKITLSSLGIMNTGALPSGVHRGGGHCEGGRLPGLKSSPGS